MIFLLKLLGFGSLLFCLHWGSLAPAQEAKSPSDNQKQKDGQTANTQDSKPTDEVELKGIFEAAKSSPIMLAPKEWATLTLDEAVAHGTTVDKGDVLLSLDTDKIDEAIDDAKGELQTETLALENAEIQFNLLRRTSAMSLADVIAAEKLASEDLKEFITTGRDRRVTSAERSVESARNSLAYQTEELRQLKKMYQADDLTEDTEEIILKRTRDAVDRAEYFLDTATDSKRRSLAYTIPRSEEELKTALKRATLALDEAQRTTPNSLKQKKLALDKQRQALDKQRKKIARLRTDRKMLKIRSPRAGVIYFGSSKRGKWTDSETISAMLQPGNAVKAKSILMTVVELEPLTVHVTVPESSLRFVQPGVVAEIQPIAYPDRKLPGKVQRVSPIPISDGIFDAILTVDQKDGLAPIVPGMKAEVKIKKSKSPQSSGNE